MKALLKITLISILLLFSFINISWAYPVQHGDQDVRYTRSHDRSGGGDIAGGSDQVTLRSGRHRDGGTLLSTETVSTGRRGGKRGGTTPPIPVNEPIIPIECPVGIDPLITEPNAALLGYPGPYASAVVGLIDSTHASVRFTGLTQGAYQYLLGGADAVALNVNATSFGLDGGVTANFASGFGGPSVGYTVGSGNVSEFGVFNFTLKAFDGWAYSALWIQFTLANSGGTWANASDVLVDNATGYQAAAHIFATAYPVNIENGAVTTGFAGDGTPPQVPEPTTLLLLGFGLVGLAAARRKFKN